MTDKDFIWQGDKFRIIKSGGGAPNIYGLLIERKDIFNTKYFAPVKTDIGAEALHSLLGAFFQEL